MVAVSEQQLVAVLDHSQIVTSGVKRLKFLHLDLWRSRNGVFGDLKIMFTVCIVLFLYRFVELTPQTPLNQRAFPSSSQQQESYVNDVFDDGYYDDDRDFLPMEVPKSMSNTELTVILLLLLLYFPLVLNLTKHI